MKLCAAAAAGSDSTDPRQTLHLHVTQGDLEEAGTAEANAGTGIELGICDYPIEKHRLSPSLRIAGMRERGAPAEQSLPHLLAPGPSPNHSPIFSTSLAVRGMAHT